MVNIGWMSLGVNDQVNIFDRVKVSEVFCEAPPITETVEILPPTPTARVKDKKTLLIEEMGNYLSGGLSTSSFERVESLLEELYQLGLRDGWDSHDGQ